MPFQNCAQGSTTVHTQPGQEQKQSLECEVHLPAGARGSDLRHRPPEAAVGHGLHNAGADHEVAEGLALLALLGVTGEERRELGDDLVLRHGLREERVQAVAEEVASEVHVVGARGLADEADLGHRGPAARVRATGHADDNVTLAEAAALQNDLEAADQGRQVALGLREGERAGGKRHAGHHVAAHAADSGLRGVRDLVLVQQRLDLGLLGLGDVGDENLLVAGHAEGAAALQLLGDLREANAARLLDTADGHQAAAMPEVVLGLVPAVEVAAGLELVGPGLLQLLAQDFLDLLAVELSSVVLDGVLDAGVLAVGAVAEVARHGHDGLADVLRVLRLAEADDIGQPRVRLLVVVGEAETATHRDVEAEQLVVLDDRDEATAVREDVDVVARRDGDGDLVLARQVGHAVDGLLLEGGGAEDLGLLCHLVAVHQEDLVVGAGAGQAMIVDSVGVLHDLVH
mmetsp:Transcript_55592/g.149919  ORF Transcript_55592/g.149919 Transcript_55592/m.149919 type:complete len:458 (-) Transcript_55592:1068-2441(-)